MITRYLAGVGARTLAGDAAAADRCQEGLQVFLDSIWDCLGFYGTRNIDEAVDAISEAMNGVLRHVRDGQGVRDE